MKLKLQRNIIVYKIITQDVLKYLNRFSAVIHKSYVSTIGTSSLSDNILNSIFSIRSWFQITILVNSLHIKFSIKISIPDWTLPVVIYTYVITSAIDLTIFIFIVIDNSRLALVIRCINCYICIAITVPISQNDLTIIILRPIFIEYVTFTFFNSLFSF